MKTNTHNFYQKGNYADYFRNNYEWIPVVIEKIENDYIQINDPSLKTNMIDKIPIRSQRIRPYGTQTYAKQQFSTYSHSNVKFDRQLHQENLQKFKSYNQSLEAQGIQGIIQKFTPNEIIQFLRGQNYYHFKRLFGTSLKTKEDLQIINNYFKQFLRFVANFYRVLDLKDKNPRQLYNSAEIAFIFSYPYLFINLSQLTMSRSVNIFQSQNSALVPADNFHAMLRTWFTENMFPIMKERGFENFDKGILQRLIKIFGQLKIVKGFQMSEPVVKIIEQCVDKIMQMIQTLTKRQLQPLLAHIAQLTVILKKYVSQVKIEGYRARIKTAGLVSKMSTAKSPYEFNNQLRQVFTYLSSPNKAIVEEVTTFPHFDSVISKMCMILGYSENQFGPYIEYFIKFKTYLPEVLIRQIIINKRHELFKKMGFPIKQIPYAIDIIENKTYAHYTKEQLIICVEILRLLNKHRENYVRSRFSFVKDIEEYERRDQQQLENRSKIEESKKQLEQISHNISATDALNQRVQKLILKMSEQLITSQISSVLIDNVETLVIKKQSPHLKSYRQMVYQEPSTNFFRQFYIIGNHIKRKATVISQYYLRHQQIESGKIGIVRQNIKRAFQLLCESIKSFTSKIMLDLRKQNLKKILNLFHQFFQNDYCELLCTYLVSVTSIENKQFRIKALDFILENLKKQVVFNQCSKQIKIENYRRIMRSITIENQTSFRLYQMLFIRLNLYLGNMIKNQEIQEAYSSEIIVSQLQQCDKFYEAFKTITIDKYTTRKMLFQYLFALIQNIKNAEFLQSFLSQHTNFCLLELNSTNQMNLYYKDHYKILSLHLLQLYKFQNCIPTKVTNLSEQAQQEFNQITSIFGNLLIRFQQEDPEEKGKKQCYEVPLYKDLSLANCKSNVANVFNIFSSSFDLQYNGRILENTQLDRLLSSFFIQKYQKIIENKKKNFEDESNNMKPASITFTMVPSNKNLPVSYLLMHHLEILYYKLPITEEIWRNLPITLDTWYNRGLAHLRKFFLQDHHQFEKGSLEWYQWKQIVQCNSKKQQMLRILFNQPNLQDYNGQQLFDCISNCYHIDALVINKMIFKVLKKIDWQCSPGNMMKILESLSLTDCLPLDYQKICRHQQYRKTVTLAASYLIQNTEFDMFQFFKEMKNNFFEEIEQNSILEKQILDLWKLSYDRKTLQEKIEFFQFGMEQGIRQYPQNYQTFLKVLSQEQITYQNMQLYQALLNLAASKISDQSKKMTYAHRYIILKIIELLLEKGISNEILQSQNFLQFIHSNLYSNFGGNLIVILGHLVQKNPDLLERYIKFFIKEIDEPLWQNKTVIKPSKKYQKNPTGYLGLRNPHSVCYMNSLFQQLYHIEQFRTGIFKTKWKEHPIKEEDLVYQFKKIMINLHLKQGNQYLNPDFFNAFKNQDGQPTLTCIQMDVDQFRNILLDRIENLIIPLDEQKTNGPPRNFIQKIFNGTQATTIQGEECKHTSKRQEEFSSICLDVKDISSLSQSLIQYFKPEILEGQNSYFCEQCQKKVKALKKQEIITYPKYLTFVLKRFQFMGTHRQKINTKFQFPLEQLMINKDYAYRLIGVIIHQGYSDVGHYFSLIKLNGSWYQFNDMIVEQVEENMVRSMSYGEQDRLHNRNAYLLLYERKTSEVKEPIQDINYEGLDKQVAQIKRLNAVNRKINLLFSVEFEDFIKRVCLLKHSLAYDLLFEYMALIKIKRQIIDIGELNQMFALLEENAEGEILKNQKHVNWVFKMFKNSYFNSSLKTAMSEIIVRNYNPRNHNGLGIHIKAFLKNCVEVLNTNFQSGPFFRFMYLFAQKNLDALKFLIQHLIIARIWNMTLHDIIVPLVRAQLKEEAKQIPFVDISQQKRKSDSLPLRYHKWKLINLILGSGLRINTIEKQLLYDSSNLRKIRMIFAQAATKASINEISKFFCTLCKSSDPFSKFYLAQIAELILKDKGDNLRKYYKSLNDLLKVEDELKDYRQQQITKLFAKVLKYFNDLKIFQSFDITWQWLLKIAAKNQEFRTRLVICNHQFSCITTPGVKNCLYYFRPQSFNSTPKINSEGSYPKNDQKFKNRYYNLTLVTTSAQNFDHYKIKVEKTRKIFSTDLLQVHQDGWDSDEDISSTLINRGQSIMKYSLKHEQFREAKIRQICGDLIEFQGRGQQRFDRGDEQLMKWYDAGINSSQTDFNQSDQQQHSPGI